jgi:type IV pilus assembly protein PilC
MLFEYKVIDQNGTAQTGTIDAISADVAISSLQRRGFVISNIRAAEDAVPIWKRNLGFLDRIKNRDIVIVSRQIATLFQAQVSALQVFRLLADDNENPKLRLLLENVSSDLQGGSTISAALAKYPDVFTPYYTSMVKAGEESGKLDQTFVYLADYLERTYEVTSKAKNALIYPAFVISTFFVVMILMLTLVIPKVSAILVDSGQEVPIYTQVVIGVSNFFVDYGIILLVAFVAGIFLLLKFKQTAAGTESFDRFKLTFPYIGDLYQKLYLSRIADNLTTMLASGIPVVKALELTIEVVDNKIFQQSLEAATEKVKGGSAVSAALAMSPEIPHIMVQMVKVGEETGNLGDILATLSRFYRREVMTAVDTLVDLIEPVMIVLLGLGVGTLLASVLIPIYNISATF